MRKSGSLTALATPKQGKKRKAVSHMLSHGWPNASGIYKMYFLDPNLFYIGSAVNLRMRWNLHSLQLKKGVHGNIHLQRAYIKYGSEALHFEVVEYVECKEDLIVREQHYLDTLQPHFNIFKNARNMLGMKHTQETKDKISATKKGNSPAPNKGKPISEELRQFLRDLYKGKGLPGGEKTRFQKGCISSNKGKHASLEIRNKISESNKKRNSVAALQNLSPEKSAARHKKSRETIRNKTPEQKAQIADKQRATRSANRSLNPPKWARLYDACVKCGSTAVPHAAKGLCNTCYNHEHWTRNHK